jgi:hypothetical protein
MDAGHAAEKRIAAYAVRPGAWNPSSAQFSVGIERQLTADITASLNRLIVRGHHLARTVNVGWPDADVFEVQPTASSKYHGLIATVNQRLSHEVEWTAAYTFSHARDDASDFDEQPAHPRDLRSEWGDSRYDQRHRFVASALLDLDLPPGPFSNIELAPIVSVASGLAQNPITGVDELRTHAWPLTARPSGYGRNSFRTPASATVDLRVLKFFNVKPHGKLDLVVEVFNLMNRVNVTQNNSVYGTSSTAAAGFARPVEAGSPRQVQFSVDFEF